MDLATPIVTLAVAYGLLTSDVLKVYDVGGQWFDSRLKKAPDDEEALEVNSEEEGDVRMEVLSPPSRGETSGFGEVHGFIRRRPERRNSY